jgi:dTDP-4-amino-4,6-dideoxygalactose transaminase
LYLRANAIESLVHYPVPAHLQKPCLHYAKDPKGLNNTEKHARQCLSIPCQPSLTDAEVAFVIEKLNDFR